MKDSCRSIFSEGRNDELKRDFTARGALSPFSPSSLPPRLFLSCYFFPFSPKA